MLNIVAKLKFSFATYLAVLILFQVIMHRKYLKGKRNNKSKQARAAEYKMVQSDIPQIPEFLSRVANFPVVHTAIDYASDAYGKAKVRTSIR